MRGPFVTPARAFAALGPSARYFKILLEGAVELGLPPSCVDLQGRRDAYASVRCPFVADNILTRDKGYSEAQTRENT